MVGEGVTRYSSPNADVIYFAVTISVPSSALVILTADSADWGEWNAGFSRIETSLFCLITNIHDFNPDKTKTKGNPNNPVPVTWGC